MHAQAHDVASPLFLYIAFHNEHDPHQAPRAAIDKYSANIKSDTYKVMHLRLTVIHSNQPDRNYETCS